MIAAAAGYCRSATMRFTDAWNRFWFAPSDPLPLAVMRWVVGTLATLVVASYGFELLRYFGPEGMLSVDAMREIAKRGDGVVRVTWLDLAKDSATLLAMHGISVAILIAFTVGLWTRATSILSLLVFLSFFHRARILTGVVEPILAMLLLYLCIGPSGAVLSVDAWLRRRKSPAAEAAAREPNYLVTLALRLMQVHTAIVYFMMFIGKSRMNFIWWNGNAAWWLVARPEGALFDMRSLYETQYILNFWTTAIVLFELVFALLIWNRTARPLLIFISAVMWTGTAILTGLVPFCLAMFLAGLAFVSADQWRGLCGCDAPPVNK